MYSSLNGRKRGLLRPASATGAAPIFRNLPLFAFLSGLLVFCFIFYIYQSHRSELYDMRSQIELARLRHNKLKSENIDFKAEMEKCKSSEAILKKELETVRLSEKECSGKMKDWDSTVLSHKFNLKQLQNQKDTCFTALDSMKAELAQAKHALSAVQTSSALLGIVPEASEKGVEGLNALLQGKSTRETISQGASSANSSLKFTQVSNGQWSFEKTAVEDQKMVDGNKHHPSSNGSVAEQEAILPEPLAVEISEEIVAAVTKSSEDAVQDNQLSLLAPPPKIKEQSMEAVDGKNHKFLSTSELNFDNALDMNEQSPVVQENGLPLPKDQIKMAADYNTQNNDPKEEMVVNGVNK